MVRVLAQRSRSVPRTQVDTGTMHNLDAIETAGSCPTTREYLHKNLPHTMSRSLVEDVSKVSRERQIDTEELLKTTTDLEQGHQRRSRHMNPGRNGKGDSPQVFNKVLQ